MVKGVEHISTIVLVNMSNAGSSPAGSVGLDLNLQKLHYQYLTTSVAVVLVVRWYFNGQLVLFSVQCCVCRKRLSELIDSAWVVIVPGQKCIKKRRKKSKQTPPASEFRIFNAQNSHPPPSKTKFLDPPLRDRR